LLAVSGRYGFHRDELYFVIAGRRLDWGYVDQPALTPLVARVSETLLGTTPTALRILPALAVGVVALLAASMARRFGGGRTAQVFAAFAAGWSGVVLGVGHLLSTAVFDFLFWTLALWLLVRILDGADSRAWLGLGVVIGIGMENKHTIGFLAVAILFGLLLTDRRRLLAAPMPWLGVVIAVVLALPNLLWQAANGWPQLEMASALRARGDGPLAFVLQQPFLLSIALIVPVAAGWWWLARADEARHWRPIAVIYVFLLVVFLVVGGKAYYIAPMYTVLAAAGSIWFERLSTAARRWVGVVTAGSIAFGLFIALPLLPAQASGTLDFTGELAETVGWPELVDQVAEVHDDIPQGQRAATVVFTGSYGEAAAIDILGSDLGLPPATSAHNNYWLWGPPAGDAPIIGVGQVGDVLAVVCPEVDQVGIIENRHGVDNEEAGLPMWLCLEPTGALADIWVLIRRYN
jgi:4-amino-4-deoxy-L-arabinose transferase-like glycosyltransferase